MACLFIKEFREVALKAVAPAHVAFCHKGVSDLKAYLNCTYHHACKVMKLYCFWFFAQTA